jgi:PTH2 family peptidyl-tRNA hydrolase
MKQILVIRKDLGMRKGKMIAQGAHASLKAVLEFREHVFVETWLQDAFTKIVVSVNSEEELLEIFNQASASLLPRALIKDAGRTEFHGEATYTAVAVGPAPADILDPITGRLKLL